jgi:hypothetical protein
MKNTTYANVSIHYSDHVYVATVRRIEDIVRYLRSESRRFAVSRDFEVFNAKNKSFQNRLEDAIFCDNSFDNHVGIFEL